MGYVGYENQWRNETNEHAHNYPQAMQKPNNKRAQSHERGAHQAGNIGLRAASIDAYSNNSMGSHILNRS